MLQRLAAWRQDRRLVTVLMAPNLLGIGYGYYYYWQVGQFDPSSVHYVDWWWWPLVADSPNAVLLMVLALLVGLRLPDRMLDSAAFLAMVYVGLWTTMLFLLYPERMGTFEWADWPDNANPLLFLTHMAMPLEALLLLPSILSHRDGWPMVAAFGVAAAVYVAVDYWLLVFHPAPQLHPDDAALHAASPWLMAGCFVLLAIAMRLRWPPAPRQEAAA